MRRSSATLRPPVKWPKTLPPNGNVGAVVGATDLDSGDTLTYSLTGADASSFTVDNNGQIKVGATTTLNYETNKKSYTVIVQVHDGKNAQWGYGHSDR